MHIKILRDTPFDKAGSKMTLSDFRVKYSYISTDSVTDEELVKYLQIERAAVLCNNTSGNHTGKWFEVEDFSIDQINHLPNDFIRRCKIC